MPRSWSPHPRYRLYTTVHSYFPASNRAPDAIAQFENEVCRRFDVAGAVCVPMARTGLYMTILETVRPGRKVIMSPLTIIDVVNVVLLAGGVPVFCDISRTSCGIDPEIAEALIDGSTDAILITHLHGQTALAHVFRDICRRHSVQLIEDAAQSFGALEHGRRLGTIGNVGIYSFGLFKNLSTWQGGMVVSDNLELIARVRQRVQKLKEVSLRQFWARGLSGLLIEVSTWPPIFSSCVYPIVRRNLKRLNRWLDPEVDATRLKSIPQSYLGRMRQEQARIGLQHLDHVDPDSQARLAHAKEYHVALNGIPEIVIPAFVDDFSNIYTYFPIQFRNRSSLLQHARIRGRDFAAQHLRNCADLPEFHEFHRDCPNARTAASELILLPTYPRYPDTEVHLNIEVVQEFLS